MGQESAGDPEQDGGGAESLQGGEPALGSGRGGRRGDGRLVVGGWEVGREEGWGEGYDIVHVNMEALQVGWGHFTP